MVSVLNLYYIKGILFVELHSIREAFSSVTADGQEKKKRMDSEHNRKICHLYNFFCSYFCYPIDCFVTKPKVNISRDIQALGTNINYCLLVAG